ncbi:MAG: hypothetical protein NTZ05_05330 [Chloroflexi bacterium]|nr:hypothetical protein [Chloroflexota bacterium]
MAALDDVIEAQRKAMDLQSAGTDRNSPEGRRAMNRLMTLLRRLSPEELRQFDAWKREEQQPRNGVTP